jgi:sulfoxide reductase heme-binding subunit YedZ
MASPSKAPSSKASSAKAAPSGGLLRFAPGTDRAGRLSLVKTLAFWGAAAPALNLAWLWLNDDLGPKPTTFALHVLGDWAIRLLIATLAVTPLRTLTRWSGLILARRTLGRFALAYALAHVGLYALSEGFSKAWSEIWLRSYLTIGFAALVLLILLGLTSNDFSVKALGAAGWRRWQQLIYPAAALGLVHFFLQSKNDVTPALLQAGLFLLLMGWRVLAWRRATGVGPMVGLALCAGLATALLEAGWYYGRSGLSPIMILAGNLDVEFEIRPPLIVAGLGLAAAGLSLLAPRGGEARRRREV